MILALNLWYNLNAQNRDYVPAKEFYILKNGDIILSLGLMHMTYTYMTNASFLNKNCGTSGSSRRNCTVGTG